MSRLLWSMALLITWVPWSRCYCSGGNLHKKTTAACWESWPNVDDGKDTSSFLQRWLLGSVASLEEQGKAAIPKVIHHIYKENLQGAPGGWPSKIWEQSYKSWERFFPVREFAHLFWDDEAMARFFEIKCPRHWDAYRSENRSIVRADLSRYCLMLNMGGIYADMDYEARANFYHLLKPGMVNLVQSPYESESVQNSLMASPPGLPYWNKLMDLVDARHGKREQNILAAAGPALLDKLADTHDEKVVHILDCTRFQRPVHSSGGQFEPSIQKGCLPMGYGEDPVGIHWGTSVYNRQSDWLDVEWLFESMRETEIHKPT